MIVGILPIVCQRGCGDWKSIPGFVPSDLAARWSRRTGFPLLNDFKLIGTRNDEPPACPCKSCLKELDFFINRYGRSVRRTLVDLRRLDCKPPRRSVLAPHSATKSHEPAKWPDPNEWAGECP